MLKSTEIARVVHVDQQDCVDYNTFVDNLESKIRETDSMIELPLIHTFTKNLYSREMFAPKGVVITSKIHKEEHQFVLLKGSMIVIDENGVYKISAPFHGITKPNTSRVGVSLEDCIWTTFHYTPLVEDKVYSDQELQDLLLTIESSLVTDRLKTINI